MSKTIVRGATYAIFWRRITNTNNLLHDSGWYDRQGTQPAWCSYCDPTKACTRRVKRRRRINVCFVAGHCELKSRAVMKIECESLDVCMLQPGHVDNTTRQARDAWKTMLAEGSEHARTLAHGCHTDTHMAEQKSDSNDDAER